MSTATNTIEEFANKEYEHGFVTSIETDTVPPGLNEDIIRIISAKKQEPQWLLDWRLKAFRHWQTLEEPRWWPNVTFAAIDYQNISYYSAPKPKKQLSSMDEVDPELRKTFEKLGIPLDEQKRLSGVAVDVVFDSVSVATTFKGKLAEMGIIFNSFSEAVREHPELVRKHLGSVVPHTDNYFAALNSAVFSDGSFCYIPKGVRCPMELSTYFRINAAGTGQFERTLIVCEEGAYVSYLEGCHPAGEQVSTPEGWRNIESLRPGDRVLDHQGQPRKVHAAMVRHHKGEMLTIRTLSRHNAFRLTPEHPVLAIRRANVASGRQPRNGWLPEVSSKKLLAAAASADWVKAGELREGDFLLVPKIQVEEETVGFSDEQVELLGYYLAEGSVHFNASLNLNVIQLSFGLHEKDGLAERARQLAMNVGECKASVSVHAKNHGATVVFYSQQCAEWLVRHAGKGSTTKCLSAEVMALPTRQVKILLDAYLAGDGNVHDRSGKYKSRMVRFSTASSQLAAQVQMLLNRLGILAWVQVRPGGEARFSKDSDRIIHREPLYQVGYSEDPKWNAVRQTETHYLVPIREITSEPWDDLVFNIDVEESHTFAVRGHAVHNCTAPQRDENQLHAAVVELVANGANSQIKYSTVQNWYPGDKDGKGGIYNFVTKRGICKGHASKISWTQVETGSAITWKYPSVILQGEESVGEFYSVALTKAKQQADTGTKMIHIGKNSKSTIVSKGISAGEGQNTYRGLVKILKGATGARNYSQCDSLLLGDTCGAHTFPYIEVKNTSSTVEHEASTSKIGEDQIFYCRQRGLSAEDAVSMIVNGFCKEVFRELPMEFAVEAQKLLGVSLEGSVG
jgi:Fe-S cluster assembly protein SufB